MFADMCTRCVLTCGRVRCRYGLEQRFRADIYRDFESCALAEYSKGQLYGLEKFWAFHHYHGLPAGCSLGVNPEVRSHLYFFARFSGVPS